MYKFPAVRMDFKRISENI